MLNIDKQWDAVVIGGGFYGTVIACYLADNTKFKKILLVEQSSSLLSKASYNNQARVHNGYHYPRSFTTAYRSYINFPRFCTDWEFAIKKDFVKLYAIAKDSKVSSQQFLRFFNEIGSPIKKANKNFKDLFDLKLIDEVFEVQEYAFDASLLANKMEKELFQKGIKVNLNTKVSQIINAENKNIILHLSSFDEGLFQQEISSHYVFNCTYSGVNHFSGDFSKVETMLKHEITEMALIELPCAIKNIGITVMDGPFFSVMPFPARKLHSFSHVRYTPHKNWLDAPYINPYKELEKYPKITRFEWMFRDTQRYFPAMTKAKYVDSLFEVKTVLVKNENDDGRPILFEKHNELPNFYSILGGKIDNIYDILEKLKTVLN